MGCPLTSACWFTIGSGILFAVLCIVCMIAEKRTDKRTAKGFSLWAQFFGGAGYLVGGYGILCAPLIHYVAVMGDISAVLGLIYWVLKKGKQGVDQFSS